MVLYTPTSAVIAPLGPACRATKNQKQSTSGMSLGSIVRLCEGLTLDSLCRYIQPTLLAHSCPFRLYSAKSSGGLPPSNLTSFLCLSRSSWYRAEPTSFLLTSRLAGSSTSHESSPLSFQSKTVP